MPAPAFDPATLSDYATDRSIRRGQDYFRSGAVETLVLRGNELEADVQGTALRPYRVGIEFDAEGVADATCTCPYDYGGWCKHIVATLLAYANQPDAVDIRSPLAEKLAALDRAQLQALLLELADRIPRMSDLIEAALPYVTLAVPRGPLRLRPPPGHGRRRKASAPVGDRPSPPAGGADHGWRPVRRL